MNKRIMHRLLAVIMAGAAITYAGLAGIGVTGAATAARGQSASPNEVFRGFRTDQAGWDLVGHSAAGGVQFHFVSASAHVNVPSCSAAKTSTYLGLEDFEFNIAAQLAVDCNGGPGSVRWAVTGSGQGAFDLKPQLQDKLDVKVFLDRATNLLHLTARNLRTGRRQSIVFPGIGSQKFYTHASFITLLLGPAGTQNVQPLWEWNKILVEAENGADHPGIDATLYGPWNLSQAIATSNGTSGGRVLLYPHWTSNGPVNDSFDIELNPPSSHMP